MPENAAQVAEVEVKKPKPFVRSELPKRWAWKVGEFQLLTSRSNFWSLTAPPGLVADDLRDPAVFGNLCQRMRRWDRVEIRANDGSWFLIAMVESASPARVTLRFNGPGLGIGEIAPEIGGIDDDDPKFRILWQGEIDRWCVIRKADNQIMSKGAASKDSARLARSKLYPRALS